MSERLFNMTLALSKHYFACMSENFLSFFARILYQAICTGNPEGARVIVGSMNVGYDIYPTLTGIELTTYSVPNARRFHKATLTDMRSSCYPDLSIVQKELHRHIQ